MGSRVPVERENPQKEVKRGTEWRKRWKSEQKKGISRGGNKQAETWETGAGSKGRNWREKDVRGGGTTGNNKASDEDEWIEVEPEWWGGNETKQGRPTKKRERETVGMKKKMRNRRVNNDRKDWKTTGRGVLEGVRLEAERLNGGPRLVPACNCGLSRGNYWIPHRISQPLSSLLSFFYSYCSRSSLPPWLILLMYH